jgi:hypothetical protein
MTADRQSIRLSMTVKIPAGVRPGDFAQRLQGYIETASGYSVDRVACRVQKNGAASRSPENEEKEVAKQEYMARWLNANGTQEMTDEFGAGALDRRAVLDMIANESFRELGLPGDDWAPDGRITPMPTVAWCSMASWIAIRSRLPADHVARFFRVADGRYGVDVTIRVGPFRFERRMQLSA